MKQLISTDWLEKNIDKVKILDASWHLPNSNRKGLDEFKFSHIKNSNFFDIDKNSNQESNLPHMLPEKKYWEKVISDLGIKNSDHVVVYDNSDILSSCRVWYNFLYFNHNPNLISVLDGGYKKWKKEGRETTKEIKKSEKSSYTAEEKPFLVLSKDQITLNIKSKIFELVDARSKERFMGLQQEPRKELKSGNIKGSKNLPFINLINQIDNTFKKKGELKSIFKKLKINPDKDMAFTCGSGVTACVLGLANSIVSGKNPVIYDGSWSEYGLKKNENIK